jgi:hypothetical protein
MIVWWRVRYDALWAIGQRVDGYFAEEAHARAFARRMALWRPRVTKA